MQPFSAALREIATIPGARYSCVVDETGSVLAEHGPPGPDPAAALRWAGALAVGLRPAGELEDVVITGERTYHLLRRVRSAGRPLLVHVAVDRVRGNLATTRRTLARLALAPDPATPAQPLPPATESVSGVVSPPLPVRTARRPVAVPRPREAQTRGRSVGALPSTTVPPRPPPARTADDRTDAANGPSETTATPAPAIPAARGWSDDLYTMRRLMDALRRLP